MILIFLLFSSRLRMLNGNVVHSESEFAVYIHPLHESGASSIDKRTIIQFVAVCRYYSYILPSQNFRFSAPYHTEQTAKLG